jgi:uncharacterized protein (TIGR02145 family)
MIYELCKIKRLSLGLFLFCGISFLFASQADAYLTCGSNFSYGGYTYGTVQIGTQCWMRQNIKTGTSRYCYNNDSSICAGGHGALFQWAAAQNACPSGWHLPSDWEWKVMERYLGMTTTASNATGWRGTTEGTKLKSGGSSGFNAYMSGRRDTGGTYSTLGSYTYFWTSTQTDASNAIRRSLGSSRTTVSRETINKAYGFSVRCVRNTISTPSVTTYSAISVGTSSATIRGGVTATGGENPDRYIQWGTTSGSYPNQCNAGAGGTGTYTCNISSLSPNTTYYFRARAINSAGWGYGSQTSFKTAVASPTVSTSATSAIGSGSATGNGNVTYTGGQNPTRYIQWGTTSGTYTNECNAGSGGTGAYSCAMTGLSPNTTYYVRAKVTNNGGTAYGSQTSFTTAVAAPTVTTSSVSAVSVNTATGNGNVTYTGGENPTCEIEWGTASGTYTESCSAGEGNVGAYSCAMTGLAANTTYFVRAKVTNSGGIQYGSETSFTTLPGEVTIPDPNSMKIDDAISSGYITVDNGTIGDTTQSTAQTSITFTSTRAQAVFPGGTTITSSNTMNFQNFTIQDVNVSSQQPDSRAAFQLGVPTESLTFSQNITITSYIGNAFNGQELDILYQNENESNWNTQGTCTVENGNCTFTTNHATIYTINGTLQATGDAPIYINTEVESTLSLDCYDSTTGSGDHDVLLGTTANPGLVTAGTPAVGQSTCDVTTNDDQGYYLTIVDDNGASHTVLTHDDPNTATTYEINDLTHYPTTQTWNAPTTKGLGFSVISFPDTNLTNNSFNGTWTTTGNLCEEGTSSDDADYAGIPNTAQTISAVTQYEANQTSTDICYKVDVPASQPSGIYQGSVTYTATSDASSYYQ